jgi:hypothetical protein
MGAVGPRPRSLGALHGQHRKSDWGAVQATCKNAEWTQGPFANNGSKNLQRNQWSIDPF